VSILNPPPPIIGSDSFMRPVFGRPMSLKERVREAIAWGCPDKESVGMSSQKFTRLLSECLREIERLEAIKK
jgi:hypothetical protein